MQERQRPRGTTLRRMDRDRLSEMACEKVNAWLDENGHPDERFTEMRDVEGYAVAETDEGVFVVGAEGVGWLVSDEKPLRPSLAGSWTTKGGETRSSFTGGRYEGVSLTPDEVRELATGEEVDLADLVRSFGDRLETNFDIWHARLNKVARQ